MQVQIETSPLEKLTADALAVICFETESAPATNADPEIAAQSGWLAELRASGEFTGKLYEMAILHRPQGIGAKRLVVVGGGKWEKFSTIEARNIGGALVRALKCKGVRSIALTLEGTDMADNVKAAVEGAVLGAWEADKYKSDPKTKEKQVDSFTVAVPRGNASDLTDALRRGDIIAESQNVTRDLV